MIEKLKIFYLLHFSTLWYKMQKYHVIPFKGPLKEGLTLKKSTVLLCENLLKKFIFCLSENV